MVHSCIVTGCNNHSNKEECRDIKFYTLPFKNEGLLSKWLVLIGKRREEVTVHSRVCSAHFVGGFKSSSEDVPQIFPWQRHQPTFQSSTLYTAKDVSANVLTASQKIDHDHCYCSSMFLCRYSLPNGSGSSHLTPVTAQDILHIRLPTTDTSTLTDQSLQSPRPFCTELFKHNNDAIHFYTGFESFDEYGGGLR